ncbi:MAG: hypothetical protein AB7T10_07840 [bacterium]
MKKYFTPAFSFLLIMLLFSSCRQEIKIDSTKSDSFNVDGYLTDWQNIDFIGADKCNYYFASQYDDSSIVLCVRITDRKDYMNIERSGMTVSFNTKRGKSEISILPPIPFDKFSPTPPMDADSLNEFSINEEPKELTVSSDFPLSLKNKVKAFMRHTSNKSILDIEIQLPFVRTETDKAVSFLFVSKSSGKPNGNTRPEQPGGGDGFENKGKPIQQGTMPPKEGGMQNHEGRPKDMNSNNSSDTEILLNVNFKD